MRLSTMLRLGRVSNLPTVWTNALAGATLAGGGAPEAVALAALSLSVTYVAGMWLNDAFDAEIDARERKERPIPRGEASRRAVFVVGFALLGAGAALGFALGVAAGLCALALAAVVTAYDWLHKRTAFGPVMMGAARALALLLGSFAVGDVAAPALWGAAGLFAYVVGLTYAAKQEALNRLGAVWPLGIMAVPLSLAALWSMSAPAAAPFALAFAAAVGLALRRLARRGPGDVPAAVVMLIAAIALHDAALIAAAGAPALAAVAVLGFALTLGLQRLAPGT